jgi:hypothetical protein
MKEFPWGDAGRALSSRGLCFRTGESHPDRDKRIALRTEIHKTRSAVLL